MNEEFDGIEHIVKVYTQYIKDLEENVELSEHFVKDLNKDSLSYANDLLRQNAGDVTELKIRYIRNVNNLDEMTDEELMKFRYHCINIIKRIENFESTLDTKVLSDIVKLIFKKNYNTKEREPECDDIEYNFKEDHLKKIDGSDYDNLKSLIQSTQDLL